MSDENHPNDKPGQLDTDIGFEASMENSLMRRWVIVRHATTLHPPTDVYEADNRLIVLVEIAGMHDSDFNVVLHGQQLTISGLRRREKIENCAYHQLEIPFGEFRTEVSVPWPVVREEVTANYSDGFLRIELPHAPAQKVQIVNVDVQETDREQSKPLEENSYGKSEKEEG